MVVVKELPYIWVQEAEELGIRDGTPGMIEHLHGYSAQILGVQGIAERETQAWYIREVLRTHIRKSLILFGEPAVDIRRIEVKSALKDADWGGLSGGDKGKREETQTHKGRSQLHHGAASFAACCPLHMVYLFLKVYFGPSACA